MVPITYRRFNGATIPPWARSTFGDPFEPTHVTAALIHDYLYDLGSKRPATYAKRLHVDNLFYQLLRLGGTHVAKASAMWAAVRLCGSSHYSQGTDRTGWTAGQKDPKQKGLTEPEWWERLESASTAEDLGAGSLYEPLPPVEFPLHEPRWVLKDTSRFLTTTGVPLEVIPPGADPDPKVAFEALRSVIRKRKEGMERPV
jgi:hypothetical protein